MKNIFIKLFSLLMLVSLVSCEDPATANVDPDAAPAAPPAQVLSAAQGYLGWIVDSRLNGQSFLWGQYWTWGPGVSLGNAPQHIAEPTDHNNYWFRCYANALTDLQELERSGVDDYAGAAKILKAYIYQGLVDHFDAIPYSEALLGSIEDGSNFAPAYDGGKAVYDGLLTDIDAGIALLQGSEGNMGSDDMLFGGNHSRWVQLGNSLKLRILMRQSVTGDQTAIGDAVRTVIGNGDFLTAPAQIEYTGESGSENPMFADEEAGIGLFYVMSGASYGLLNDLGDPRLAALYSPRADGVTAATMTMEADELAAPTDAAGFRPVPHGGINELGFGTVREEFSQPNSTIYGNTQPVVLMSNWEVMFLRAEAAARYNTGENDETLYRNAINANCSYLGVDGAAYASGLTYDSGASLDAKLNLIGTQKWISMNGTQEDEGWIESRRFDREGNRIFTQGIFQNPPQNTLGGATYPSAWLYPQDEQSLNSSAPNQRTITDKVFWDN